MIRVAFILAFAIGVLVAGSVVMRGLADRRPGAAIVLSFYLDGKDAKHDEELWSITRAAIETRASQLGGARVSEVAQGQLRVKFPGRKAAEIASSVAPLIKTGRLDFRLVHREFAWLTKRPAANSVPLGYELLPLRATDDRGNPTSTYFAVKRIPVQTGTDVAEARPSIDAYGHYQILVKFTDAGSQRFAEVTGAHVGELLGIVLDGQLYSAPRINERISGGHAQITGNFSQREAIDLANSLSSPLPLPATFSLENEDGSPVDFPPEQRQTEP